jgi:release factor glutamine methyltransferase
VCPPIKTAWANKTCPPYAVFRMTLCIGEMLRLHSKQLISTLNLDPASARIEVQCLLQAVLQVDRTHLLAHAEQALNNEQQSRFNELFDRRLKGEPIAYLIGEREFYGLSFKVSPATLIPRPETELLVELALQRIPSDEATSHSTRPSKNDVQVAGYPGLSATLSRSRERGGGRGRVLDLGTGSGAIALSIADARPDAEVVAVDVSKAALKVAQFNAQRLNLGNVKLLHSNWFDAIHGERFDIVVSNPPYVAIGDAHLTLGDVRFEPRAALASGADGLEDIRHIVEQSKDHLNSKGWLLFEHGYDQAVQVRALLQHAGFDSVFSARDLAGIERVSGGSWPASMKTAG